MSAKKRALLRVTASLLIGAGCAVYAPFSAFAPTPGAALRFVLWGGAGFLCCGGLTGKLHRRLYRYALPLSFGLALSFALGAALQRQGALIFQALDFLAFAGIWALCFPLLCHLFSGVPLRTRAQTARLPARGRRLPVTVFICFFVLACGWLLAFFPIMTNYDIHAHLSQIAAGSYDTHHSLLYTLLIRGLLAFSALLNLGNEWAFLALGLFQAAVLGVAVAYGVVTMRKQAANRGALIAVCVYYCVFPLFGYFAFSTTKDTLFAAFLLLSGIELYRVSREGGNAAAVVRMMLFAVLACLLRYNGMLTLILLGTTAALHALYRLLRRRSVSPVCKRLLVIVPVTIALATGAGTLISRAAGAVTPDTVRRDMLSLPLQQMARALQTAQDEADIARIEGLFGVDDIPQRYRADITDPVKAAFLYPDENTASALRAWLKLSVKYPVAYLEAFLQLTRGAWFADDLSHTKIDYWLSYTGYLETTQKYTEADFPIAYRTFLPALRTFLEDAFMENRYLQVPGLPYVFALAVQTWITVTAFLYAAYHRRAHALRFLLFALCALLPVFLLPCMISRYFLPLFLLNPLGLLALTTRKENAA